jgi:ArsR family transcriptional regulator, arsenate/arsenite/antimonite-responsive transcriptional repressor
VAALCASKVTAAPFRYFVYYRNMEEIEESEMVRALAALAHPARLKLFRALVVVGRQGLTPGTIAEALSMPPATLSFHLKELVHAQLLTQERVGRNLVYRADYVRMNAVLAYLTAHCCQGADCLTPAAAGCTTC